MQVPQKLFAIIRWVMRDVKYHKHYLGTVQSQSPDKRTVDILPDDEAIRSTGLQRVPLDTIPGVSAQVPPGAQVTLYFANGDPEQPRARWVEGSPIELAFADGVMPVARVGDTVTIPSTGLVAPLGGGPVTGVATGTIAAGAPLVKA